MQYISTSFRNIIETSTKNDSDTLSDVVNMMDVFKTNEAFLNSYCNDHKAYLQKIDVNLPSIKEYIDDTPEKIKQILNDMRLQCIRSPPEEKDIPQFVKQHPFFYKLVDIVCDVIKENGIFNQLCWGNNKSLLTKLKIGTTIGWFRDKDIDTFRYTFYVLLKHIRTIFANRLASFPMNSMTHRDNTYQQLELYNGMQEEHRFETHPIYSKILLALLSSKLELTLYIIKQILDGSAKYVSIINGDNNTSNSYNNNNVNLNMNLKPKKTKD